MLYIFLFVNHPPNNWLVCLSVDRVWLAKANARAVCLATHVEIYDVTIVDDSNKQTINKEMALSRNVQYVDLRAMATLMLHVQVAAQYLLCIVYTALICDKL